MSASPANPSQTTGPDTGPGPDAEANFAGRKVVVAGYGLVGRCVADRLSAGGFVVTVVEMNPNTIQRQQGLGKSVVHGDVSDPQVLDEAGIRQADALILTVPDEEASLRACEVARQMAPNIFIAARTNFLSKGLLATQAGADHVTVEEVVTAEAMQQAVMRRLLSSEQPAG